MGRYSGILTVCSFSLQQAVSEGAEKGSVATVKIVSGGRPDAVSVLPKASTRDA